MYFWLASLNEKRPYYDFIFKRASMNEIITQAIVIRSTALDQSTLEMREYLEGYFGKNVYVVLENYSDESLDSVIDNENVIRLGRKFLERNGFRYFKKVGWQCGDYVYYGALEFVEHFSHVWLIEPDVRMTLPPKEIFGRFENVDVDLVAANLQEAKESNWYWYPSMDGFNGENRVYKMFFPLSRLSVSAIRCLRQRRKEYCESLWLKEKKINFNINAGVRLFANDETFVATTVCVEGLTALSLSSKIGDFMKGNFTYSDPILEKEIDHPDLDRQLLHPICTIERAREKVALMRSKNRIGALQKREAEVRSRLGDAIADSVFDIELKSNTKEFVGGFAEGQRPVIEWLLRSPENDQQSNLNVLRDAISDGVVIPPKSSAAMTTANKPEKKIAVIRSVLTEFPDVQLWRVSALDVYENANGKFISKNNNRITITGEVSIDSLKNTYIYFSGKGNDVTLDGLKNVSKLNIACINGSTVRVGSPQMIRGAVVMASHAATISIGRECLISSDIILYSSGAHALYDMDGNHRGRNTIEVGNRVWIGQGVRLLAGANVGENSVIGAYSVLAGKIPNNCAAAGNPCRVTTKHIFWTSQSSEDKANYFERPENVGKPSPSYVLPTRDDD